MIIKCRFCKSNNFREIVDLGNQPLSGIFPNVKSKDPPRGKLNLIKCKKCNLMQLKHSARIDKMYGSDYGYNSSLSKLMVNHLKSEFNNLMNYAKPIFENNYWYTSDTRKFKAVIENARKRSNTVLEMIKHSIPFYNKLIFSSNKLTVNH